MARLHAFALLSAFASFLFADASSIRGDKPMHCIDAKGALCWRVHVDNKANVAHFTATCKPIHGIAPGWCAFGLPIGNATGVMGPAEVFWLSRLSGGAFSFEDRVNLGGHFPPTCLVNRLSTLVHGNVEADGTLHATWTRPALVNSSIVTNKYYVDVARGSTASVIAAWGNRTGAQSDACGLAGSGGWSQHKLVGVGYMNF